MCESTTRTITEAPTTSTRWWYPLALLAIIAVLFSATALWLPAGAIEPLSPWWWFAVTALHVPFGVILLVLIAGLVERIGYLVRGRRPEAGGTLPRLLPRVCVQLPMFNERAVAGRAIATAGALIWPRDLFEIQVLDDSTDPVARAAIDDAAAVLRAEGVQCSVLRRRERRGFKAGALEEGRRRTDAPFISILDADFTPDPEFLLRMLPYFYDAHGVRLDDLAVVQARWGHLNREQSALTRTQSLWVDDHHTIQMSWRSAMWRFVNFTGTAAVWNAQAIERAGGWRAASLVEDCELSFRALFAGYRTRFVKEIVVPAELPATLRAYRAQQKRWTQGWAQLQRLHCATLVRAYRTRFVRKIHLCYHMLVAWQWPLWGIWLLTLPPLIYAGLWFGAVDSAIGFIAYGLPTLIWLVLTAMLATFETARIDDDRRAAVLTRGLVRVFPYSVINAGMLPHQVAAFCEGLFGPLHAEFERTPKTASVGERVMRAHTAAARGERSSRRPQRPATWAEVFFVAYQVAWAVGFAMAGWVWPALIGAALAVCVTAIALAGTRTK